MSSLSGVSPPSPVTLKTLHEAAECKVLLVSRREGLKDSIVDSESEDSREKIIELLTVVLALLALGIVLRHAPLLPLPPLGRVRWRGNLRGGFACGEGRCGTWKRSER